MCRHKLFKLLPLFFHFLLGRAGLRLGREEGVGGACVARGKEEGSREGKAGRIDRGRIDRGRIDRGRIDHLLSRSDRILKK